MHKQSPNITSYGKQQNINEPYHADTVLCLRITGLVSGTKLRR